MNDLDLLLEKAVKFLEPMYREDLSDPMTRLHVTLDWISGVLVVFHWDLSPTKVVS